MDKHTNTLANQEIQTCTNIEEESKYLNVSQVSCESNLLKEITDRDIEMEKIISTTDQRAASSFGKEVSNQEIIIKEDLNEVKKLLINEIIAFLDQEQESETLKKIKTIFEVQTFTTKEELSKYLNISQVSCQAIVSETRGQEFLKEFGENKKIYKIYIFSDKLSGNKDWMKGYKRTHNVGDSEELFKLIKKDIIKEHLPCFVPVFDAVDKSENRRLHFILRGLCKFENRDQGKKDAIAIIKEFFGHKKKFIEEFERNYNKYDKEKIFEWYTREAFFYKIINNCLRSTKADVIQYVRLILKDLKKAIKKHYKDTNYNNFCGVLYRGTQMSEKEWNLLKENTGRDIEINGFLSTTKDRKVASCFGVEDLKVIITIILPALPDRGHCGYADIEQFSCFKEEKEILFNIMSRFTILATFIEKVDKKEYRNVILLYGAQSIKKYISGLKKPINITLEKNELVCHLCRCKIVICQNFEAYISLSSPHHCICKYCLQEFQTSNKVPLLYLNSFYLNSKESSGSSTNLQIHGLVIEYPNDFNIPFYGYQCSSCKKTGRDCAFYYKCLVCQASKKAFCDKCFDQKNDCAQKGHSLVLENVPFSFWCEQLSEKELFDLKYHKEVINLLQFPFKQAEVFNMTYDYKKAKQHYEKFIEQSRENSSLEVTHAHLKLAEITSKVGNIKDAINEGEKALDALPSDEDSSVSFCKIYIIITLAQLYSELGKYSEAIKFTSIALDISERVFGNEHLMTAIVYHVLGANFLHLKQYQEAREYTEKSLKIFKSKLGNFHPHVAISYVNLGEIHFGMDEYKKAIDFKKEGLDLLKSVIGEKDPRIGQCYSSLASSYMELGQYKEAIEIYFKAKEIDEYFFGDNSLPTACSYLNLGSTYNMIGSEKALEYLQKAQAIYTSVYKDEHPFAVQILNFKGLALQELGRFKEALTSFQEALKYQSRTYPENDSLKASLYVNIGNAYDELVEYSKAVEFYEKALYILQKLYGDNHLKISSVYHNLGTSYRKLEKLTEAEAYHLKALDIRKSGYGEGHPKTALTQSELGLDYHEMNDLENARENYLKALENIKNSYGEDHPKTANIYNNLGMVYCDSINSRNSRNSRNYHEAKTYLLKALEIRINKYEERHMDTAESYNNIGILYDKLKMYPDAVKYYLKSIKVAEMINQERHLNTASTYNSLGVTYILLKKYQEAKEYHLKALEIRRNLLGEKHSQTAISYGNLGATYNRLRLYDKAFECCKNAFEISRTNLGDNHSDSKAICIELSFALSMLTRISGSSISS